MKESFKDIDVFFVSMDIASAYGFDLRVILEAMSSLISASQKVLLLFDEVQYMGNWALMLKIIYDKFKNAFIIATGSS